MLWADAWSWIQHLGHLRSRGGGSGERRPLRRTTHRTPPGASTWPTRSARYLVLNVALKTAGDPRYLVPAVREVLHEIDAHKPSHGIHALQDLLGATYARDWQTMLVMTTFAVTALLFLLALFGVHGVLLHRVREQTREIGIRLAIGASLGHVVFWVAGQGLRLV